MVWAEAECRVTVVGRQRTHPRRGLQFADEEVRHLRTLLPGQILRDGGADGGEVVAVAHRNQRPIGLAGVPEVQPVDRRGEVVGLAAQVHRVVEAPLQVSDLGRHAKTPHVGRVEAGHLVDVAAHTLEQVVDFPIVGELVPTAQPLPGGRPLQQVLRDAALRTRARRNGLVEEGPVAAEADVVAHETRHRVVVDGVPVADRSAREPFGAEVRMDVGGDPVFDVTAHRLGVKQPVHQRAETEVPDERRRLPVARHQRVVGAAEHTGRVVATEPQHAERAPPVERTQRLVVGLQDRQVATERAVAGGEHRLQLGVPHPGRRGDRAGHVGRQRLECGQRRGHVRGDDVYESEPPALPGGQLQRHLNEVGIEAARRDVDTLHARRRRAAGGADGRPTTRVHGELVRLRRRLRAQPGPAGVGDAGRQREPQPHGTRRGSVVGDTNIHHDPGDAWWTRGHRFDHDVVDASTALHVVGPPHY